MVTIILVIAAVAAALFVEPSSYQPTPPDRPASASQPAAGSASAALALLEVKGRAPKTDYRRTAFGDGWAMVGMCDTRNIILHRDMPDALVSDNCKVMRGTLHDPYTGTTIAFSRGADTSDAIQIDHVVALSDAWQKGAATLTPATRQALANDPLELLAVDGPANQAKGDGDAATWLPPNKSFRCAYVARQIAVKAKYGLWITPAERDAMQAILATCPSQTLPTP